MGILLVVHWPNHGPGVDVEQGASLAWGALTVAHATRIAHSLAAVPGNGAVVPSWIFPGCERVAQHTGQVWDWGDIQVCFQETLKNKVLSDCFSWV